MLNDPHLLADRINECLSKEQNQQHVSATRDIVATCIRMLDRGYAEDDPASVAYRTGYTEVLTRLHHLYTGEQPEA